MTIASTTIESVYTGNGVATSFPITFEFTDVADIKLYLDGVSSAAFAFDNALAPTAVIPTVVPALGVEVKLVRETEVVQSTDLLINQNYSDSAEAIEDQFDRIVQMVQEIEVPTTTTSTSSTVVSFPDWGVATAYDKGTVVYDTLGEKYYRVVVDNYVSDAILIGADIMVGSLEVFPENNQGDKGEKGDQGIQGVAGANGSNGLNGATGADGIFSAIATQGEAEAGVNNVNGMTPLRTKQAFDEYYSNVLPAVQDQIDDINLELTQLGSEINLLKSSISTAIGRYAGAQGLGNGEVTPIALTGANGGVPLVFNKDGTEFVNVQFYVKRENEAFSSFEAVLHYVNGAWLIGRKDTMILDETLDVDGITLSVQTVGAEGQVYYTSSTLVGSYTEEENYIMWLGQEIPKTILNF